VVTDEYRRRKRSGFSSDDLDVNDSVNLLLEVLQNRYQLFLVLDGLDECPEHDRRLVLRTIKRIFNSDTSRIKALIISRDDQDVALAIADLPNFSLDSNDNGADLEHYIREEVRLAIDEKRILKGKVSDKLQQDIIQSLTCNAGGM
jgi:hypothetical protein